MVPDRTRVPGWESRMAKDVGRHSCSLAQAKARARAKVEALSQCCLIWFGPSSHSRVIHLYSVELGLRMGSEQW